jgi:hypothetical protein
MLARPTNVRWHPKTKHGKEVAADRLPGDSGNYIVGHRDGERCYEKSNGIVDPQTTECRSLGARKELRNRVANRICKRGESSPPMMYQPLT